MNNIQAPLNQAHKNVEHCIHSENASSKRLTMQDIAALVQPSSPLIMDERKVIELSKKLASRTRNTEFFSKSREQ